MKKYILLGLIAGVTQAQNYNAPESVKYHLRSDRYFISNNHDGQILVRSAEDPSSLAVFASDAPNRAGLEVLNGILFAASGSGMSGNYDGHIKGYNLTTGALVMDLVTPNFSGNGISSDGKNTLYVSGGVILKIDISDLANPTYSPLPSNGSTPPSLPNGLFFDKHNNRLLIVTTETNGVGA